MVWSLRKGEKPAVDPTLRALLHPDIDVLQDTANAENAAYETWQNELEFRTLREFEEEQRL
jgi:hypothetical protein